jgi:dihydrofolate synthase / folylpolyglutamate synthase
MKLMKIQKILKRLLRLHPKSIDLSLDRIKRLLKDLNNPENKIKNAIQVVGTNGKYSFCTTIREIFETAGYKVNLNVSPSLRKFNERYYFAGKYIDDNSLYKLLSEVEKVNDGKNITFHEFICACFFLKASRTKADINIIESGLFFRLDASNVLKKNIASVIMPIGIDHKDFLKKGTVDEIVYEKCSSLLNQSKIIIAEQKINVLRKIKKTIKNNSSNKIFFQQNYNYKKISEGFVYKDSLGKIKLPKPNIAGDFQISNIATAIATVRSLDQFNISKNHIKKAITKIRSEGRLQRIIKGKLRKYVNQKNEILIDGAHNPLAALQIKKYLKSLGKEKKIVMVLGMMFNKEHKKFIKILKSNIDSVVVLDIPNQINTLKKEKLLRVVKSVGLIAKSENSIKAAFKNISKEDKNAIIFCTGSLYFAGEILNLN